VCAGRTLTHARIYSPARVRAQVIFHQTPAHQFGPAYTSFEFVHVEPIAQQTSVPASVVVDISPQNDPFGLLALPHQKVITGTQARNIRLIPDTISDPDLATGQSGIYS
jgi:hypothetical protein